MDSGHSIVHQGAVPEKPVPMSVIVLTDIVLEQSPDGRPCLSNDCVFVDIFAREEHDDNTSMNDKSRPATPKMGRLGPLVEVPDSTLWRAKESLELSFMSSIPSITIVVSVEHQRDGCSRLGSIEMNTHDLHELSLRGNDGGSRFCKRLSSMCNNAGTLVMSADCMTIPLDCPPSLVESDGPHGKDTVRHLEKLGLYWLRRSERTRNSIDIDKSIVYHEHMVQLLPESACNKHVHLNNLGISYQLRFQHSGELVCIEKAISAHQHAVRLTPEGHPDKPTYFANLGKSFFGRFDRLGEFVDIEAAISAHNDAISRTPKAHPDEPARFSSLGNSLLRRFERSGKLVDIEEAISAHNQAVSLTPNGHPDEPARFNNLGNSFLCRFKRSGKLGDIEEAISAQKRAVSLTPDGHPDKPAHLNNLGISFTRRFTRLGELVDIDEAVSAHQRAVHLTPDGHPVKPWCFNGLGNSFLCRFQRSGTLGDIEEAISAHKHAVHLTPDGHPQRPAYFTNLGNSFLGRFNRLGEDVDIMEAISAHRHALRLTPDGHPNKPTRLQNLGNSFLQRFERSGKLIDIEEALSAYKHATSLTPDEHPNKPSCLSSLGRSFLRFFQSSGELVDIEEAISAGKHAVRLTPDGHPNKPGYFAILGNSFLERFERSGELVDIEEAISAHKHTLHLTPDGHTNKPGYFNDLGNSFMRRFERFGELVDLEQAISANKQAIHFIPDGHPGKLGCFTNLGTLLQGRFQRSGRLVDIEEAISAHKHALHLTSDRHPNKPVYFTNLGNSFLARFYRLREDVDIKEAISAHKDALRLTSDGHPNKPVYFANLGNSIQARFDQLGELVDIEEAISAYKHAVLLTPDGHARKPGFFNSLGNSFARRFHLLHDNHDLDNAIKQFRHSATSFSGAPLDKFHGALRWARLATANCPLTSLDAYLVAINLLPRVAWLGQTISQRHEALISIGRIGNEAAAAAIALGEFDTALEWLEQGRSVVWGQLLNLRTPVNKLRSVQSQLADDLVRISTELDSAGTRERSSNISVTQVSDSLEQAAKRHYRLAEQWDSLVEQVRAVPGFEDFLRPKRVAQLLQASQSGGPVVYVNVHESRCDALILIPGNDDVVHLPLEHFSYRRALKLQGLLRQLLSAAHVRMRDERGTVLVPRSGAGFSGILSILWQGVAKPVLESLAFPVSDSQDPPRIWWCLTGPLSFLPIHAAGLYDTETPGSKISDYVTSSYTPTLTALLERSQDSPTAFQGLLGVSQPCTPGQSPLPNAAKELTAIEQLGSSSFHIHSLPGELATIESVVKGMAERSWVHLACHAIQDHSETSQSAFCLHDGRLTLSKIISNSFSHADFAFLSACQTAQGDEKLSEEAAHLAGGMVAAGYRSVIATMWSIKDEDAPMIAKEVYSRLIGGSSPDSSRAAHALHHATKALRAKLGEESFLSWVPFIHVGV